MNIKDYLHVVLTKDDTMTGGVDYEGQTFGAYVIAHGLQFDTLEDANAHLVENGISPLHPQTQSHLHRLRRDFSKLSQLRLETDEAVILVEKILLTLGDDISNALEAEGITGHSSEWERGQSYE